MKIILSLAVAAVVAAGSAFAGDKETIQSLNDQFSAAAGRGDVAAIAAMYAPDAVILPPGSPALHGHDGAMGLFGALTKGGLDHLSLKTDTATRIAPNYIREIGVAEVQMKGAAAQSGTYVVIWKRVQGHWRLWTDIFH